jgi:hypothetical protein
MDPAKVRGLYWAWARRHGGLSHSAMIMGRKSQHRLKQAVPSGCIHIGKVRTCMPGNRGRTRTCTDKGSTQRLPDTLPHDWCLKAVPGWCNHYLVTSNLHWLRLDIWQITPLLAPIALPGPPPPSPLPTLDPSLPSSRLQK